MSIVKPIRNIVIAEDTPIQAKKLAFFLKKWGFGAKICNDGQIAYDYVVENPEKVDLIITDYEMPNMNGIELVSAIKNHPQLQQLMVIMLSTVDRREVISEGLKVGAHEYLIKPFEPGELRLRVSNILKIKEYNERLIGENEILSSELDKSAEQILTIFRHIRQGIFTLNENLEVRGGSSQNLDKFIAEGEVDLPDFFGRFLERTSLTAEESSQVKEILSSSLGKSPLIFSRNEDRLPREIAINGISVEVEWVPMLADGVITQFMVCIHDVSELAKLRDDIETQKESMDILYRISKCSPETYFEFSSLGAQSIEVLKNILSNKSTSSEDMDTFLRGLYSMKCLTRSLSLDLMYSIIHELESLFSTGISTQKSWEDLDKLLLNLIAKMNIYDNINYVTLGRKSLTRSLTGQDVASFMEVIDQLSDGDVSKKVLIKVKNFLVQRSYSNLKELVRRAEVGIAKTAEELGANLPVFSLSGEQVLVHQCFVDPLLNSLGHLTSNSLVHGLQPNKPGLLYLSYLGYDGDKIKLEYGDNGRGLNLKFLHSKWQQPVDPEDDVALAETVFESGVSSSESISNIAGRGVGMGVVRQMIEAIGGSIDVRFVAPESEGFRPFVFSILLPKHGFLIEEDQDRLIA